MLLKYQAKHLKTELQVVLVGDMFHAVSAIWTNDEVVLLPQFGGSLTHDFCITLLAQSAPVEHRPGR